MNAVTRHDIEQLYKKEEEAVNRKYGNQFLNEQEALGTLISEWEEAKERYGYAHRYYIDIIKGLIAHECPTNECKNLIEAVADTIQELIQVGAACYKMLRGTENE